MINNVFENSLEFYIQRKGTIMISDAIAQDEKYDLFSTEQMDEIVIIRFKEDLLFRITDLNARDAMIDYLDRVSENDSIKVIVIFFSPDKSGIEEYFKFYHRLSKSKWDENTIHRLCNVVDQLILKIVDLNKIVVHANSGRVISLFLNISLACDYRIIADNTVYQNPYIELGLVPKGGGPFFLPRILGLSKAYEILLSNEDLTADEALRLGIVDKVVPLNELEDAALDVARSFALRPLKTLSGIKKLLNYSAKDLKDYLDLENKELLRIVEQSFWE